jgi:hypothetical protein
MMRIRPGYREGCGRLLPDVKIENSALKIEKSTPPKGQNASRTPLCHAVLGAREPAGNYVRVSDQSPATTK